MKKSVKNLAELGNLIATHQANLQRLAAAWGERIIERLDVSEKKMMVELVHRVKSFGTVGLSAATLRKFREIEKVVTEIRGGAFNSAYGATKAEALDLAANEVKWASAVTGALSGKQLRQIGQKTLERLVNFGLFDGDTMEGWFHTLAGDDTNRIMSAVRNGLTNGLTIQQLTQKITGTAANNYRDGILQTTRNSAVRLARTAACGVADEAKMAFYFANSNAITKIEHLSTLDGRVCPICGPLSGTRYDMDIGAAIPHLPIHPNCRCVHIPVTPLSDIGDTTRPAANADFDAEAKRIYEARYPDKNFDDLAPSTRKKYYYEAINTFEERTGQPPFSQIPGSMKFKDWISGQSEQMQRDWFSRRDYRLFEAGKLDLDKYFSPNPDARYSIAELKAMDKELWQQRRYTTSQDNPKQSAPFGFGGRHSSKQHNKFSGKLSSDGELLNRQMKKQNIPSEIRDEINWNHTVIMQNICKKNPNITSGVKWPGVAPGTRDMSLCSNTAIFEGCRPTCTHEYGHYVANSIFDLSKTRAWADFEEAVIADWKVIREAEWIKPFEGIAGNVGKWNILKNELSEKMFGEKNFIDLNFENQWKIIANADILGSVSGGAFGFGHSAGAYLDDLYREAFANMYLVHKYKWEEFQKRYPNLWNYMENLTK